MPATLVRYTRELRWALRLFGPAGLASAVDELLGVWWPSVRTMNYRGFKLFYGRGWLAIHWVKHGRMFQKSLSNLIVAELASSSDGAFVDVGAGLGLITLNVLAALPSTRVFAFEAGARQYGLLSRTISENGLDTKVTCYRVAIGEEAGARLFAAHEQRYDDSDGFLDTGRAPLKGLVTVDEQTLDGWWHEVQFPAVRVIKIETAGSELWVLRGAVELVARLRPIIFLEIQPPNFARYPHLPEDVFDWLETHGYQVEGPVEGSTAEGGFDGSDRFVARPASLAR